METDQILKYPVLSNNLEVRTQVDVVKKQREQLAITTKTLEELVAILQDHCNHNLRKIMEFDKSYRWGTHSSFSGDNVMKGKECTNCGFFKQRPEGRPWVICHKCGGAMEYKGKTPGQGGDGEHISKCKDCGHTVSHT